MPENNIYKENIGKSSIPLSWTRLYIFYYFVLSTM